MLPLEVEFEWDPEKARANLRKHKVPFLKACEVFKDDDRLERLDASTDDEDRWAVLGRVEQTILFVVYAQRGERIRLISARRATRYEQRTYWIGEIPARSR
ncbi:MAG: BrnT family toxin [Terracidiphilus sp.]